MLGYSAGVPHRSSTTTARARVLALALTVALGASLSACVPEGVPMPVPTTTASETPLPAGDGVLTIGTLFPTTGASTFLARAQDAGVELAVREINEAGGVNGKPVVVYHRDSGDASTTKAETSFTDLESKGVDVVIGPSSSVLAERLLPALVNAGVTMISPSATSPVLSSLKDQGLLFRTIPSEALEGSALADVLGKDSKVAIIYYADDADRAVRDQLASGLERVGGTLVASEAFSETVNDADKIISVLTKAEPDAIVLASPFSAIKKNKEILLALAKAKLAGAKLWLTSQNLADYSQALPGGTLTNVNGILEGVVADAAFQKRVKGADPSVTDYRYAAEAYDATILAALAATVAGNDSGRAVAATLKDVSAKGIKCTSFGECLDVLKTRTDIDYDGISGPIGFDEAGDPRQASFGLYRYSADNKFKFVGSVMAG
jgi:branched-chain amino acid transport system substrate-binding protein